MIVPLEPGRAEIAKLIAARTDVPGFGNQLDAGQHRVLATGDEEAMALIREIKARRHQLPILMLTARGDEPDKVAGLDAGADDYITKPFNFEVLIAKVKNILVLNDTLKNTYTKRVEVLTPKVKSESSNDKLIKKIVLYIEDNLTDTQLSVETLSRHVGMSRGTLYNKLLELTGQTPVEFIRSVKLDKAAELLENNELTIAEVAYSAGFSTPNYFAKAFKAKFNMLPSEYIIKKRKSSQFLSQTGTIWCVQ